MPAVDLPAGPLEAAAVQRDANAIVAEASAALVSAVFALVFTALFYGLGMQTLCVLIMSLLLVWRHKENIGRLLRGEEGRVGATASAPPQDPSAGAP